MLKITFALPRCVWVYLSGRYRVKMTSSVTRCHGDVKIFFTRSRQRDDTHVTAHLSTTPNDSGKIWEKSKQRIMPAIAIEPP